jgi:putative transposase
MARYRLDGLPHYVAITGNRRQPLFRGASDFQMYLELLATHASQWRISILGYCLLPHQVHLIVAPEDAATLERSLQRLFAAFAKRLDRLAPTVRIEACALEEPQLWRALAFTERQPLDSGLSQRAPEYPWSSAFAHTRGFDERCLLDLSRWQDRHTPRRWTETLRFGIEPTFAHRLAEACHTGRPLGSPGFLVALEEIPRRPAKYARGPLATLQATA